MLPEHIIYDEMKRHRDEEWQPEALRLPLHPPPVREERQEEEVKERQRGVLIIDMNEGYAIIEP